MAQHPSEGNRPASKPFVRRIESLRALGSLAVAGHHLAGCALNGILLLPLAPWETAGPVQNAIGRAALALFPGHAALMMFFVISGFVLRLSLQFGPQSFGAAARKFLISRAFRIYPIVFAGIGLFLGIVAWLPRYRINQPARSFGLGEIVANLFLLKASMIPTLWALQVALLMTPCLLLLYFLERRFGARLLVAIALITTALSFVGSWALFRPLSFNFFPFVLGMLIPTIGKKLAQQISGAALPRWILVAVAAMFLPGPVLGYYSHFSAVVESYGAAILIGLVSLRADLPDAGLLENRVLRGLGRISMSYYVLHLLTFPFGLAIFGAIIPKAWSAHFPVLVGLLVIVVWLLAITPLTWLSYRVIEAPGIALGRRLARMGPGSISESRRSPEAAL
jgi:peptidoglycan/LPS O-acetylase OafA/YrhL